MQYKASTPKEYIEQLPEERKKIISSMRSTINKHLPKGYKETIGYGMLAWVVPHSLYKNGYHVDPSIPLPFLSLASQKNYISLYHMALYEGKLLDWFREAWKKHSGKKLDMGKCCIRFKKPEDVPLELIAELCTKMTPEGWIKEYEKALNKK